MQLHFMFEAGALCVLEGMSGVDAVASSSLQQQRSQQLPEHLSCIEPTHSIWIGNLPPRIDARRLMTLINNIHPKSTGMVKNATVRVCGF